jgi:hypothetical protein
LPLKPRRDEVIPAALAAVSKARRVQTVIPKERSD